MKLSEHRLRLYLHYRRLGYSHIEAARKVLADERLQTFIQSLAL